MYGHIILAKLAILVPGYMRFDDTSIESFLRVLLPATLNYSVVIFFSGWYEREEELVKLNEIKILAARMGFKKIFFYINLRINNTNLCKNAFAKIQHPHKARYNSQYKSIKNAINDMKSFELLNGVFDYVLKTRFDLIYEKIKIPNVQGVDKIYFPPVEGHGAIQPFDKNCVVNDQVNFGQRDQMVSFLSIVEACDSDEIYALDLMASRKNSSRYSINESKFD